MKRALAATVVAASSIVAAQAPASAHHPEPLSFIACAVVRPTDHVVDHAHPYFINPFVLLVRCVSHDIDSECEYDAAMWSTGKVTGPYPRSSTPCHKFD